MRGRVNAGATVPATGPDRVHANVIVVWDDGATLADQEEAIKAAARDAIIRVREVAGRAHLTHVHRSQDGSTAVLDPVVEA